MIHQMPANPDMPVYCPVCKWHGKVKQCDAPIDAVVVCRKCGAAVERE